MRMKAWLAAALSAAAALPCRAAAQADSTRTDAAFQTQLESRRGILDQARQFKEHHEASFDRITVRPTGRWQMLGCPVPQRRCGKLDPALHSLLLSGADRLVGYYANGCGLLEFSSLQKAQAARGRRDSCAEIRLDIWPAN